MLFSPLTWALFAFTLFAVLPGALAAPVTKRSKKSISTRVTVETYPAIEGEEVTDISIPRRLKTAAKPAPVAASPVDLGNLAPVGTPLARKESIEKPVEKPAEKFTLVPATKRDQILKRLQLCQTLFLESGRAYDYRTMTNRELEVELITIRQAKAEAVVRNEAKTDPKLLFRSVLLPLPGPGSIEESSVREVE